MSNETQIQTRNNQPAEAMVEFTPFAAADKIKLTVSIVQKLIAVPTRSGKTCSERDAMKFIMLCKAQRLNPFAGDAYLVGYDGQGGPSFSLITAHQAFLKRAETCNDFEGMESGVILLDENDKTTEREGDFHLPDEKVVGGWARVHRKGRKPTYRRIRLERFNNGFAQWKVDPAGMICKCAEADALRSTFPTLLGGLHMDGEILEIAASVTSAPGKSTRSTFDLPPTTTEALNAPVGDAGEPRDEAAPAKDDLRQPEGEKAPEAKAPAEKPRANHAKALKGLLALSGISEVDLIAFLHQTGQLDESVGTIAEMAKVAEVTLQKVHDGWSGVEAEIKKTRTSGAAQ